MLVAMKAEVTLVMDQITTPCYVVPSPSVPLPSPERVVCPLRPLNISPLISTFVSFSFLSLSPEYPPLLLPFSSTFTLYCILSFSLVSSPSPLLSSSIYLLSTSIYLLSSSVPSSFYLTYYTSVLQWLALPSSKWLTWV